MRLLPPVLLLVASASCAVGKPDSDAFCRKVLDIYQRGDTAAYLALIETDPSTPALVTDQSRMRFEYEAKAHPATARMEAITSDGPKPYERDGVWYAPTLEPVARVVVTFEDPSPKAKINSTTLFVGLKAGQYRLITVKSTAHPADNHAERKN